MHKILAIALGLSVLGAGGALANDKMTVTWKNSTGASLSLDSFSCQPASACSLPSSIANGANGTLIHQASPGTYIRSMIAKYAYYAGSTKKSCQVSVTVYGPSSTSSVYTLGSSSFLPSDGLPQCIKNPATPTVNPTTGDLTWALEMK